MSGGRYTVERDDVCTKMIILLTETMAKCSSVTAVNAEYSGQGSNPNVSAILEAAR